MSTNEEKKETMFFTLLPAFPYKEGSKIDTFEFLRSSRSILQLVDKLGKVFAPVKYDMNGNIVKLTSKFEEDPERFAFVEDMIMSERQSGGLMATEALLWLCRGLHFLQNFLETILEDTVRESGLSTYMRLAYSETLERYHGWMGWQLFNIMCRFAPSRQEFIQILGHRKQGSEEAVYEDMDLFVSSLGKCVEQLMTFYTNNGLETQV